MSSAERVEAEVYDVLEELAPSAASYLCVGVQEGRCLARVIEANPRLERVVLCDTWGRNYGGTGRGDHAHIAALLRTLDFQGRVHFLDGDSTDLIPTVAEPCDLTYVDGDHSEAGAYADLVNVWRVTRLAMVVHDSDTPGVRAALMRFMAEARGAQVEFRRRFPGTAIVRRIAA